MFSELLIGVILIVAILLFLITVGNELFTIMVDEQLRYLRLITYYAPVPGKAGGPAPVTEAPETRKPQAGCVHIRHTGRIRFGKDTRWLDMRGEAFFSIAVPGYVWRTTIRWFPGIWLDAFDYYVDRDAGMCLNLWSIFPLNNSRAEDIRISALFRYLACIPLFPMIIGSSGFMNWERSDGSNARARIRNKEYAIEALITYDGKGRIEAVESCRKTPQETGRPPPGQYTSRFSDYTCENGFWIPSRVTSGIILPKGDEVSAEYIITNIDFPSPYTAYRRSA